MIDNEINKFLKSPLEKLAFILIKLGVSANAITFFGFFFGILSFILLVTENYYLSLFFFIINRFCDGLDGHVARNTYVSDLGGFYDITFDFIVYSLLPIGFILNDTQNAMAFSFLLSAFIGTSSTFLASAWIIEKNKNLLKEKFQKSFFYTRGITEGFETILFFILIFLFPSYAYFFAWIFGILCWITVFTRILFIRKLFNS